MILGVVQVGFNLKLSVMSLYNTLKFILTWVLMKIILLLTVLPLSGLSTVLALFPSLSLAPFRHG